MSRLIDLKDRVYGALKVRCRAPDRVRPSGGVVPQWFCLCACGNLVLVEGADLRGRTTKSCGCMRNDYIRVSNSTHGQSKTPEYVSWLGMHRRCYEAKCSDFSNYGGRGISVCWRWRRENPEGLKNFIRDMGRKVSREWTIERTDVNGDYCPENCTWVPKSAQSLNLRRSVKLTYRGITRTQNEWARIFGVYPKRIAYHLSQGKNFSEVVSFLKKRGVTGVCAYA